MSFTGFPMLAALASLTFPQIDPVVVRLGPVAVRWYGLAYVAGFVLAYLWLRRMTRSGRLRVTTDQLTDLIAWAVAGVLVGGRLGWWLFYHRRSTTGRPAPPSRGTSRWRSGTAA
jgi:phosphatidylglycerol---prolipoprotein diacylglyceryl transferase